MARSDRPVGRKLYRLWTRLRHGRALAHAEEWSPGLSLDPVPRDAPPAPRRILWRGAEAGQLLPFEAFAALLPAEVTIYGSGPSIRDLALGPGDGARAILLNGALELANRIGPPLAFFVEDERFVWRHFALIRDRLPAETPCAVSVAALRALLTHDREWARGRPLFLIDNLEKPYGRPRRSLDAAELDGTVLRGPGAALSRAPGIGVVRCGTVAFTALQFCLAAAPRTIALAGIDLANADRPRFYEQQGMAKSGLVAGLDRILAHFRLALSLAGKEDIRLSCLSRVSALLTIGYDLGEVEAANKSRREA